MKAGADSGIEMITIEIIIHSTDKEKTELCLILLEDGMLMAACLEQRRKGKKTAVIRCEMPSIACGGFSSGVNQEDRKDFLAEYEKGEKRG